MNKVKMAKELVTISKILMSIENRNAKDDIDVIDFNELERMVSRKIGTQVKFDIGINKNAFTLTSQDIKDKAGILKDFYTSFTIENFGGGYTTDEKHYWLPLAFSWEHGTGSSNGKMIGKYLWDFAKNKWIVK